MTDHESNCIFCRIARKEAPAFVVYEDDQCMAFLDLRQVRPGHTMVIPKMHINHFIDLDDGLTQHILSVAGRIARKIRQVLMPPRIGYVVAGFGVPHAHFHVQPMWEEHDITSQRYLDTSKSPPAFDMEIIPIPSDEERQKILDLIKI